MIFLMNDRNESGPAPEFKIVDCKNGQYRVSYTAEVVGIHTFNVLLKSLRIDNGTTYKITALPGMHF